MKIMRCNLCRSLSIILLGTIGSRSSSVLSDLKTSPLSPKIYRCKNCGHLQKFHTTQERDALRYLYDHYENHPLPKIGERLFYPESGRVPRTRTYQAIKQCLSFLPASGKLLDIGTGNGAVLKSAGTLLPKWRLYGFDLGTSNKKSILKIPGVQDFFTGNAGDITAGPFDLIVSWHSLEHAPDPAGLLSKLRRCLKKNGLLLIQVPDLERTPFDLAVMDHCSHFTKSRLLTLCASRGFRLLVDGEKWTHNCITFLCKKNSQSDTPKKIPRLSGSEVPEKYFYWLNNAARYFKEAVRQKPYVVFGTSIAAIWLLGQMTKKPLYFLDMDERAVGHQIEGIPIIDPSDTPTKITLLMAFSHSTGRKIAEKIKQKYPALRGCDFILSPP